MVPIIRHTAAVLATGGCLYLIPGCTDPDCLSPPTEDATAPTILMTILYRPTAGGTLDTLTVTQADSTFNLDARADDRLRVGFMAHDIEGLRRVQLGVAELTTVGIGVDSRRIPVEPVRAACPRAKLSGVWQSPSIDAGTTITLAVVAENWTGLRSTTETVSIRLR